MEGVKKVLHDAEAGIKKIIPTKENINMLGQEIKKIEHDAVKGVKKVEHKVENKVKKVDIKKIGADGKKLAISAGNSIKSGYKKISDAQKDAKDWLMGEFKGATKDVGSIIGGFTSGIIMPNIIPIIIILVVLIVVFQII